MDFDQYKLEWRAFLLILGLFTQIRQQIDVCITQDIAITCLSRNKYLSNQVSYLVIIWLGLSLYWRDDENKLSKLSGKIQGAIVTYSLLVMLAYWLLLSGGDTLSGWDLFSSLIIHYVYPITFTIDWLVYESIQYEWSFYKFWIVYPLLYLGFLFLNGLLSFDLGYIYDFLNPVTNGAESVIIMVFVLLFAYSLLAIIIIFVNKMTVRQNNEND